MGCCWSEKRDSEEAYSRSESRACDNWSNDADGWDQRQQPVCQQRAQRSSNGWDQSWGLPDDILWIPGSADREDGPSRAAPHSEERHFFHLFFQVMEHVPGHQGILRRWEKEDQRAAVESGGRCQMGRVWRNNCGYVESLQRVRAHVASKQFQRADRERLGAWAYKVVQRRAKEYNAAQARGKADSKHLKVLQEWQGVNTALRALL